MKRPCLDCGILADQHRCPTHLAIWQTKQEQYRSKTRPSTNKRGYDNAWRRIAKAAITARPWCEYCGAATNLTADHIIPLARGGTSEATNVAVLCRTCNSRKGAR